MLEADKVLQFLKKRFGEVVIRFLELFASNEDARAYL